MAHRVPAELAGEAAAVDACVDAEVTTSVATELAQNPRQPPRHRCDNPRGRAEGGRGQTHLTIRPALMKLKKNREQRREERGGKTISQNNLPLKKSAVHLACAFRGLACAGRGDAATTSRCAGPG